MTKSKPVKKRLRKIKAESMDKVKIKRVKRAKKKTTTKEKILAGIGLGSTLMGGAGAVAPKTGQTQFVRSDMSQSSGTSATSKIKQTLSNIFGVKSAKAAITQEYLDSLGANVEAARTALANFDQWVTEARADAQNYGTQEETDARLVQIQDTVDSERPALVSAVEAAESAYSQAADQFAAEQQGGSGVTNPEGPATGAERINSEGFTEVYNGSGWQLKDGQTKVILGIVYTTQNGVWIEQQQGGQTQAPKEGDTKTENSLTYTYKGGQWVMDAGQRVQNPNTFWYLSDGQGGWTLADGQTKTEGGIIYTSQGGEWVEQRQQGPSVGDERINSEGFTEVYNGSGWQLKDGQEKVILGVVYVTQNGIWVEKQTTSTISHTYTITTGASSVSVDAGSGAGMTYEIRDENGQLVEPSGVSFSDSNPGVARSYAAPGTVQIMGLSAGTSTVTINYGGASTTFEVNVNALPGSGDQGGGSTGGTAALSISAPSVNGITAGQYQEFPFQASGGSGLYTWEKVSGPDWLLMDPATGVLYTENMPANLQTGTVSVTVRASDGSTSAEKAFSISVYAPSQGGQTSGFSVGLSQGTLTAVSGNYIEFANALQVSGGSGSYSFSIAMADGSMLPAGIGIGETGIIYVNDNTFGQEPVPAGSYMLTVSVVDLGSGETKNITLNLQVQASGVVTPPSQTVASLNFSKTDGSSASSMKVGDTWKISIAGAKANAQVLAETTQTTASGQTVTGTRVLGMTDAQGSLIFTDTVTTANVGTWQANIKVDGQQIGSTLSFAVTATTQAKNSPVDASGILQPGWILDTEGRYYNQSLNLYSNRSGTVQAADAHTFDNMLIRSNLGLSGSGEVFMDVYVYNAFADSFHPQFVARNPKQYATQEIAQRLAQIFGGSVQESYFGQIDGVYQGPYSDVIGQKVPTQASDFAPMYAVKVGDHLWNAGALADRFRIYSYDQAVSMTLSELAASNSSDSSGSGATTSSGGSTTGSGTTAGTFVLNITSLSASVVYPGTSLAITGQWASQGSIVVELVDSQGYSQTLEQGTQLSLKTLNVTVGSGVQPGKYSVRLRYVGTGENFGKVSNSLPLTIVANTQVIGNTGGGSGTSTAINAPVISQLSATSVSQSQLSQTYKLAIVGSNYNSTASQNSVEIVNSSGTVVKVAAEQVLTSGIILTLPKTLSAGSYTIRVRNLAGTGTAVSNSLAFTVTASATDTTSGSGDNSSNTGSTSSGGSTTTSGGGTTTTTTSDQSLINQLQNQIAALQNQISTLNSRLSSQNSTGQTIVLNSTDTAQIISLQNQIQQLNTLVQQLRSGSGTISVMGGGTTQAFQGLQMPAGYSASGGLQYQDPGTEGQVQGAGVMATYTVKKGDTLWNIAKKYYGDGKKWRKILEANPNCLSRPGNTRTLKIGAELTIPNL